jgi:hypothetical protein
VWRFCLLEVLLRTDTRHRRHQLGATRNRRTFLCLAFGHLIDFEFDIGGSVTHQLANHMQNRASLALYRWARGELQRLPPTCRTNYLTLARSEVNSHKSTHDVARVREIQRGAVAKVGWVLSKYLGSSKFSIQPPAIPEPVEAAEAD